jgi:hypothetical protein
MIMRAIASGKGGSASDAAKTVVGGWVGPVAAKSMGLITSFIARRVEQRMVREFDKLGDIGIDRGMPTPRRRGERAEQKVLRRH